MYIHCITAKIMADVWSPVDMFAKMVCLRLSEEVVFMIDDQVSEASNKAWTYLQIREINVPIIYGVSNIHQYYL